MFGVQIGGAGRAASGGFGRPLGALCQDSAQGRPAGADELMSRWMVLEEMVLPSYYLASLGQRRSF